jgi:glucose-6-phosphate 1-dehydrogenase
MNNSNSKILKNKSIALVVFGVTGDLTRRKLIPAIYQLFKDGQLPLRINIVGFARREWTNEIMKENLKQGITEFSMSQPVDEKMIENLINSVQYIQSTFEEDKGYKELLNILGAGDFCGVIYYLATPPNEYLKIIQHLGKDKFHSNKCWSRIVVEKPFGNDLISALDLEKNLHLYFKENEIFRIDHYLGKETVQNILVFRFANGIFEPLWNNHYVDHVQITVAETIGVGTRAGYFENSGIIRDMFANHLLQLLTLTAMEAPFAFNADSVRDEKLKVLRSIKPLIGKNAVENTIRAQYGSGTIGENSILGYKEEPGVMKTSTSETYLAIKLSIDNWRWAGVPFYIRCGKRLPIQATEIIIHFKQVPLSLFEWKNMAGDAPNTLVLRLQPDEGISLTFGAKKPGHENQISPVLMDFCYQDVFGGEPPEAYERLLLDCMMGDATLFTRSDEVIEQWEFTQKILDAWKQEPINKLPKYKAGSWGPIEADLFIQADGRKWKNPKKDYC